MNRKSRKLSSFEKMPEKLEGVPVLLSPIALRKAKIVYNFGLSECTGVKMYFKRNKN